MSFALIYICFFSALLGALCFAKPKWSLCVHLISWFLISLVIVAAWVSFGRPPFKTFFETYILLSWSLLVMGYVLQRLSKQDWVLPASSLLCAGVLGWALLNPDLLKVNLPPALQSVWFVPHVMVYFLGYASVFLSGVAAFIALFSSKHKQKIQKIVPVFVRVSFVLLGVGLILGALWADDAWGTYWGWDPKENWALVTWLLMAAYIHLPKQIRDGRKGMYLVLLATLCVGFTYLGMHLLPTADLSVHVYTEK